MGGRRNCSANAGGRPELRFVSELAEERTARATASVAIRANPVATTDINFNFRHVTIWHLVGSRRNICGARELGAIGMTCLKKYFR